MSMATKSNDLSRYATLLPYASTLFGIYQPLLGWKSRRIRNRFELGQAADKLALAQALNRQFTGMVEIRPLDAGEVSIDIKAGVLAAGMPRTFDSVFLEKISQRLPAYADYEPTIWPSVVNHDVVDAVLRDEVSKTYQAAYASLTKAGTVGVSRARRPDGQLENVVATLKIQLAYESAVAGAVLQLATAGKFEVLADVFYQSQDNESRANEIIKVLAASDGIESHFDLETIDPQQAEYFQRVALSPIGVVHLFRQYFFELDTFLGSPVGHVWLSPGSSVELLEVHSRQTTTERIFENSVESILSSQKSIVEEDEFSEAISQDNQQNIAFGASVIASYASIDATSSFDYERSQQMAREATHRRMRNQSETLASEIRKNFKSTFKTLTETTDVASSKHVLSNTTDRLVNYEMRRKMRQIGVQVQDVGTFLCWQTYVDDPGSDIGISKLIHVAKPPNTAELVHPEEIPLLQPFQQEKVITIPFISADGTNADNKDEVYEHGVEVDDSEFLGSLEKIKADFLQTVVCPKANYELANMEFDPQGKPVAVSRKGPISNSNGEATFVLHLDSVDFQGQNSVQIKFVLHWKPLRSANDAIREENARNLDKFSEQERAAYEKAYVENVRERVTVASRIKSRDSSELRDEERIVVYRRLIQDMLTKGIAQPDDRTRHVVAEVINSVFDVNKMLYFVAPEWWRPRLHRSRQQLGETPTSHTTSTTVDPARAALERGLRGQTLAESAVAGPGELTSSVVGWGGVDEHIRDNYFITEDSERAKFGSSLGWLLQLDGDNLRNAFLNAPWVKAVIPVRPGKEEVAINWLKAVEGMNGISDDTIYHTDNPNEVDVNGAPLDGQRLIDVLFDLAKKIGKKHRSGLETGQYPHADEIADPDLVDEGSSVSATPIDRVYEHGFYPLRGGFRSVPQGDYEVFDQWTEILPTDQIVPVEVQYDPKTGRQIES